MNTSNTFSSTGLVFDQASASEIFFGETPRYFEISCVKLLMTRICSAFATGRKSVGYKIAQGSSELPGGCSCLSYHTGTISLNRFSSRPNKHGESKVGHVATMPSEDNNCADGRKPNAPFHSAGRLPLPVAVKPLKVTSFTQGRLTISSEREI